MQVSLGKIAIPRDWKTEVLNDGGVRFVLYKQNENTKELLEFKKSTWDNSYNVKVNMPSERCVDTVIVVTRTSMNCYRVIISNPKGTLLTNCKTYDEVNRCISKSLPK